ncbi:MAG: hypothetical protein WHS85_09620 [Hydrogenophilus sp.]
MTHRSASTNRDEAIRSFWKRRETLSEAEWHQFYDLVVAVLRHYRPPELRALPESDEYLVDFFTEKVFQTTEKQADCQGVGALRLFYRNYLRDRLRYQQRQVENTVADLVEPAKDGEEGNDEAALYDHLLHSEASTSNDCARILFELDLTPEQVAESARSWLRSEAPWAVPLIAGHCGDEPLRAIANRYQIPAYHNKVKQLGINWKIKKGERTATTVEAFRATRIGQWLERTGIAIAPDQIDAIHCALNILCDVALSLREQ